MAEAELEISVLIDSVEGRVPVSSRFWRTSHEQVDKETLDRIANGFTPATLTEDVPIPSANYLLRVWPLFMGTGTSVYEVVGQSPQLPKLALVYKQYCPHPFFPQETSVVDYWFLKYLEGTDLAPRAYYLSAPWAGGSDFQQDGFFSILKLGGKLQVHTCEYSVPSVQPVVRYILMDRLAGQSVNDIGNVERGLHGRVSVRLATKLGFYMVDHLEKLHARNVVHGDAHHENFIFDPKTKTMRLIDFERARIIDSNEVHAHPDGCRISKDLVSEQGHEALVLAAFYSPWESRQCMSSFRDDIHKVFVSLAALIHGDTYLRYFHNIALGLNGGEAINDPDIISLYRTMWMNHRFNGDIFTVNGFRDSIKQHFPDFSSTFVLRHTIMPKDKVQWVGEKLHALEEHVMSLGINERPNYALIKKSLAQICNGVKNI